MDKISRIVPSSARVQSTDLDEAHPVRPGVPAFGRAEGHSSKDRVTLSTLKNVEDPLEFKPYRNTPENAKAKIVEEMNAKFFGSNARTSSLGMAKEQSDMIRGEVLAQAEELSSGEVETALNRARTQASTAPVRNPVSSSELIS